MSFDFLVLSIGRVGTQATSNYLNIHPEISSPPFARSDACLLGLDDYQILGNRARFAASTYHGLLLHHPDLKFKPEVSAVVKELVHGKKMIHVVRDPLLHLAALYNHLLHSALMNGHPPPLPPEEHYAQQEHLASGRYFAFAREYYDHFDEIALLDFSQLGVTRIRQEMPRIYDFIGADPNFSSASFDVKQLSNAVIFMKRLPLKVEIQGRTLEIRMRYQHSVPEKGYDTQIASIPSIAGKLSLEMDDVPLVFYAHTPTWNRIENREQFVQSGQLAQLLQNFLGSWVQKVETFNKNYLEKKVTQFEPETEAKIREALADDVAAMRERFPILNDLWTF